MSFPISSEPKIAVIFDQASQKWYPLAAGAVSTSIDYNWIGENTFENVLNSLKGINNFTNIAERNSTITSPVNGIICYVQTDNNGNRIDQFQYYDNGWKLLNTANLVTRVTNHSLILSDGGKTILMDSAVPNTLNIPAFSSVPFSRGEVIEVVQIGEGETTITNSSGVQIKTNNEEANILTKNRKVTLTNLDTDVWLLSGIDPEPPLTLGELSDVDLIGLENNSIIQYNSSINSWVVGSVDATIGTLTISQGGTGGSTKVQAQRNLGFYIQESQPLSPADGDLWFW